MNYFGEYETGLILAADLHSEDENCRLIEDVRDVIDVVKIGSPLVYRHGFGLIERITSRFDVPVFADLKVADVPHTNVKIVEEAASHGASAVMVHGIVGPDGLADCIEAGGDTCGIIVQLELTNPGGTLFTQPIAEDMAVLAAELGAFGTQAPGNRPDRIRAIRKILGPEPTIVCCGVGHQGGRFQAVREAGGSYAIVGRSIYQAADPREAALAILRYGDDHGYPEVMEHAG